METETKFKHERTMVVPNKFVKKLFEFVLKSDRMTAFVKEYEEDGPNWLSQFTELTVAFGTTTGDECQFGNMERQVYLKFRANLEAKKKERKELEEKLAAANEGSEVRESMSQAVQKKESPQSKVNKGKTSDANPETGASAGLIYKKTNANGASDNETGKPKPVLPDMVSEKKPKRKRMVEVEISSSEDDDDDGDEEEEVPLTQPTGGGKHETELMKQIRKAREAKKKRQSELSGDSDDDEDLKVEKPKKKKSFTQTDKVAKKQDDDLVDVFRCPICKKIFETEKECIGHINVTHKTK